MMNRPYCRRAARRCTTPLRSALAIATLLGSSSPAWAVLDPLDNGVVGDGQMKVWTEFLGDTVKVQIAYPGGGGPEDVLDQMQTLYDVGADGSAVNLEPTKLGSPAFDASTNCINGQGNFNGPNGSIDWSSRACLPLNGKRYNVTVTFNAFQQPFGKIRFISLLTSNIEWSNQDDSVGVFGTAGTPGFRILSIDQDVPKGFTRGIGPLQNMTFAGWAAADADRLETRVRSTTPQAFTLAGDVNTNELPQYNDTRYPGLRVYGDRNHWYRAGYGFAFDINETAMQASYSFFIENLIPPVIFTDGFERP
ncbi:hypothetical protein [Dokdonella sp.]|uniref:hypothetical protein n=1 Tax=Dokdonella sp. TaxID=2291710 RepID=UPI0027BB17B3|nr:hypothetical protein [Dokdonella sp.]